MKLKTLLSDLPVLESAGSLDVEVAGVQSDTRRIRKGDLFVAVRGEKMDGHDFVGEAVSAGASAVVCERMVETAPSVTRVRTADARVALARLAACLHGRPSEKLRVIGITGTNGKTTTSHLIAAALEAAGMPAGVIGTISYRFGNRELPAPNTTPPADELQGLLEQMLHANMKAVVMEVSSHALVQRRVAEVSWDAAVWTNLTQDHLDYHKTMEAYLEAKKLLFRQLGLSSKRSVAVLNMDDPKVGEFRGALGSNVEVMTYGLSAGADVRAESVEQTIEGCRFTLMARGPREKISSPLCGAHNVLNCLAAAAAALALGADLSAIRKGIESVRQVPGRLERVNARADAPFAVFVDYAHTDDALRNVLSTLRPLTKGRLITVFGCGGNRDRSKRPLMGRVASELSDVNIVTTDNPRHEDPAEIAKQIVEGFGSRGNHEIVLDRKEAILKAFRTAGAGDVVLLAGKGHETYQEIRGTRSPFDDRKIAVELLESLSAGSTPGGVTWKN